MTWHSMVRPGVAGTERASYLTLSDIARIYRVHPSTARRWAREDTWRRTSGKPMAYHLSDAQASWDKRHTMRTARLLAAHLTRQ